MNHRAVLVTTLFMIMPIIAWANYSLELELNYNDHVQLSLGAVGTIGPVTGKTSIYYIPNTKAIQYGIKIIPNPGYNKTDEQIKIASLAAGTADGLINLGIFLWKKRELEIKIAECLKKEIQLKEIKNAKKIATARRLIETT